uniref:CCHC-type domain-containing protein n=1 Tax=Tanacetum cinerariifolium TaxID=118510 RepID=A0A6L2MM71_TANCI|nr:hypothetical protein [Tanacetum cinerariifolium]
MSNTNNNLKTQTSSDLHNAIMEAGGKDRPLILAPGEEVMETYETISKDTKKWIDVEVEVVQCYNCKEFKHVARECKKPKRAQDLAYHKEKMTLSNVHNNDDDNNVFANERQHPEQPEFVNDTYLVEQGDTNITLASSDMSNNEEKADHDDQMLQKERELLASLIEQLKIKTDETKQNNKSLESSNQALREANTFLNNELKKYKDSDFV